MTILVPVLYKLEQFRKEFCRWPVMIFWLWWNFFLENDDTSGNDKLWQQNNDNGYDIIYPSCYFWARLSLDLYFVIKMVTLIRPVFKVCV